MHFKVKSKIFLKKILIFFFGKLFLYQFKISQEYVYQEYRKKYNIPKSVIFSGNNVRLEGEGKIFLGEKSSIGANSWIMSSNKMEIRIGDRCAIAPNVIILTQNFFSNQNLKMERLHDYKNIIIGNDTWIGANTFIKQGVRIGNNCVVEANSVVKKDLEDFTIYNNFEIKKIKL